MLMQENYKKANFIFAILFVVISFVCGFVNLFSDKPSQLTSILCGSYIDKVLTIFFHNLLIFGIMFIAAIFLIYFGPGVLIFLTYYMFGVSLSTFHNQSILSKTLRCYPHFILETMALALALYICFNISFSVILCIKNMSIIYLWNAISEQKKTILCVVFLLLISASVEAI